MSSLFKKSILIITFLLCVISQVPYAQSLQGVNTQTKQQFLKLSTSQQQQIKDSINQSNRQQSNNQQNSTNQDKNEKKSKAKRAQSNEATISPIEESFMDQANPKTGFSLKVDEDEVNSGLLKTKSNPINLEAFRQFGYDIFEQNPYTLEDLTSVPVGPEYLVGPGDSLVIRIWGKLEERFDVIIDKKGEIYLPSIGHISLAGERFGNLQRIIQKEVAEKYTNVDVSITMSKLRTIKVFVLGDVYHPGAYDISSLSTVLTALYASGGPTKMGTLRRIKVIRNNKVLKEIDLYEYLLKGNRSQDIQLKEFDTIFIPVIGDVIRIGGKVKRPGIFELTGTTTVYEGVEKYAGGFSLLYYYKRIIVERIELGERHIVLDYEFESPKTMKSVLKKAKLKTGDVITILPILSTRFNEVSIQGNVVRPGRYELEEGMTLSDLVQKADGMLPDSYLDRIEIYRFISNSEKELVKIDYNNTANHLAPLQEFDIVRIYSKEEVNNIPIVRVDGKVKRPGKYRLLENMTVLDLAYLAGPNKEADLTKAELVRRTENGFDHVLTVDLESIKAKPTADANIKLRDYDYLFIREDFKKNQVNSVTLVGEVRYPGKYIFRKGETLADLIKRAGNLTSEAFSEGLIFKRESVKQLEREGGEKALEEERKRLIYDQNRINSFSGDYENYYQKALKFLEEQIEQNSGRLVLENNNNKDFLYKNNSLQLENGDEVMFPATPSSIQIVGGVKQPAGYLFREGKRVRFYIDKAGGLSRYANKSAILLIKPNGVIEKYKNQKVGKGDTIYVPEKIKEHFSWGKAFLNSTQAFFNIAAGLNFLNIID